MKILFSNFGVLIMSLSLFANCSTHSAADNLKISNEENKKSIKSYKLSGVSDNTDGYDQYYTDEDNETVIESKKCYQSAEDAEKAKINILTQAKQITEKSDTKTIPVIGISKRYILKFENPDNKNNRIFFFGKNNCHYSISSATLENALDFESWRYF